MRPRGFAPILLKTPRAVGKAHDVGGITAWVAPSGVYVARQPRVLHSSEAIDGVTARNTVEVVEVT